MNRTMRSRAIVVLSSLLASMPAFSGESESQRHRPLLGVQRWDMYSGEGATQRQELGYLPGRLGFLKPAEWHDRAPFFVRLTKDVDWVKHPRLT